MAITTKTVDYEAGGLTLEGICVFDDAVADPRPGVLIVHTALGLGEHELFRAKALVEKGYVAFIADLYGKGVKTETNEESIALARDLVTTAGAFDGRMAASMAAMRAQPVVDANRTAAIGYCLGGRAVLNLARLGDAALGVVSFHGGLLPHPEKKAVSPMKTKVLILHGWNDPYDAPERVVAIGQELTEAGADWQIHAYGGTGHSFTNPFKAPESEVMRHHPDSDRRSWKSALDFLEELFPVG